ncbi:hypothetical protein AB0O07_16325 [Streptomyces sp. NPDC093085]|uniref:hypothetical protein n=1 Tax=Streptomyces sp. NPDC093085 TaxID=3155068 RepID=UPI00342F82B9
MSAEAATPTPSSPTTPIDPPLTRAEFIALTEELVADTAPRLFAVVQSYEPEGAGVEEADAWVAAWGMAFEEHAEIVSVGGGTRMRVRSLEWAVGRFERGAGAGTSARVVWVPGAA